MSKSRRLPFAVFFAQGSTSRPFPSTSSAVAMIRVASLRALSHAILWPTVGAVDDVVDVLGEVAEVISEVAAATVSSVTEALAVESVSFTLSKTT